ncbi:serine/threonine protein kinase [Magnaporthiopsis poae ATCC 64411]|uniref:Serine/threonine protein kinase n=1 Tax=Magnaporthiopsis poae (strain ATCC 64411 / 73-15) TaxID=644358 RepID=A0A0C4E9S3_MAGP6|nr:serine/threonine protein kinase [Magnaporthiopsis poae ATCC 64411]
MPRHVASDHCDDFREWVGKHKLEGACLADPARHEPRYLVPRKALEHYWTDDDNSKLVRLLVDTLNLNVRLDNVRERLLCTLSTLLYISDKSCSRVCNVEHIHRDLETGISDKSLPADHARIKKAFLNDPYTADQFYHAQFLFSPIIPGWDTQLPLHAVLPLRFDKFLREGNDESTPTLARYTPHPDCGLQDEFYVLKQFPQDELGTSYAAEREMYRALARFNEVYSMDHPARLFPRCDVAFQQNKRAALLLEYADGGSLEDMFQRNNPPFTRQGVLAMWDELVRLFRALYSLHCMAEYTEEKSVTFLHQDIKPGNILVFLCSGSYEPSDKGEYGTRNCYFKLADFGQSCEVKDTLNRAAPHNPGNRTYNHPALFTHDKHVMSTGRPATPETDVWSLACVLFETAVWIVCGEPGRVAFRNARTQENETNNSGLAAEGFQESFHDGLRPLKALEDARAQIKANSRTFDQLTLDIVNYLLDDILRMPSCSPTADYAAKRIQRIIDEHRHGKEDSAVPIVPSTPNSSSRPPLSPPATDPRASPNTLSGSGSNVLRPEWGIDHQTRASIPRLEMSMPLLPLGHHPSPNPTRFDLNGPSQGSGISIPLLPSPTTMTPATSLAPDLNGYAQPAGPTQGLASPLYSIPSPYPSSPRNPRAPSLSQPPPPPKHPNVTVQTICSYRKNGKKRDKDIINSLIEDVESVFAGRDQVILIDDQPSMYLLKQNLRKTCEALATIVKPVDRDGIDVRFASRPSEKDRHTVKNATSMLDVFDANFDTNNTRHHSSMADAISCILQGIYDKSRLVQGETSSTKRLALSHRQSTRRSLASRAAGGIGLGPSLLFGPLYPVSSASSSSQPSGTTVYVLTDGVWGREEQRPDDVTLGVAKHIQEFILKQQERGFARNSVVIQLINVGNDEVGTQRMEYLDDHLWSDYSPAHVGSGGIKNARWDIVDTKSFEAPLWSILVGAIDKAVDERPLSAGRDG